MAILNFPNEGLYVGYEYIGENQITYTFDGVKWAGASGGIPTATTATSGVVKVDGTTIAAVNGVISAIGSAPLTIDGGTAVTVFN